jgi:hypothetical protein
VEQQDRERRPLLRAAEREPDTIVQDLEWAQNQELQEIPLYPAPTLAPTFRKGQRVLRVERSARDSRVILDAAR